MALVAPSRGIALLNLLDAVPKIIIDKAQRWDFFGHPLVFRIGTRNASARIGVFDKSLPIVGDPPPVELIIQNAIPSKATAIDC